MLRVFAEEHDPAGVERAVDVVVTAMHVEGVLGERARADFEDHGAGFAGRVIVLLDAVDNVMQRPDAQGIDRGKLERLLSVAWLDGRKSGLEAAQAVYSDTHRP